LKYFISTLISSIILIKDNESVARRYRNVNNNRIIVCTLWRLIDYSLRFLFWPQLTLSKVKQTFGVTRTIGTIILFPSLVFSERELMFTFAICRGKSIGLSVVCNVRAPYSGDWNFRQCFYAIWYCGHPLTFR